MKRIVKIMIMVVSVCMFLVLGSLTPVFAAYYITPITNNQYDDVTPKISNNGDIVWVGIGDFSADIFVYDGKTKVISQLMNDGLPDESPAINDNGDIVWRKLNLDEADYNIMMYKKATGQIRRISLPYNPAYSHNDNNPQINDLGQVAYESAPDGLDPEIMFYDGTTVTQITNNTWYDTNPMLNNNGDIVWMASTDGVNADIWLRTNGTNSQISTTAMEPSFGPRMNDAGDIVWTGWDPTTSYYQIYYFKRSTGAVTKVTSTPACDNSYPQINAGGQITWVQLCGSDGEIMFRNGLTGTNMNISGASTHDDIDPQINDNGWVVWSEDMGTNHTNDQIFVWNGSTKTRVTNDAFDHVIPMINNHNTIAWQGTNGAGSDWEILMATTSSCPQGNTPCNDYNACTLDWCNPSDGFCKHDPIVCSPMTCMIATCNTVSGCVYVSKDCNDSNACTIDSCNQTTGECTHQPLLCPYDPCNIVTCLPVTGCVFTPRCNDYNICTDDRCDPMTGACSYPPKNCDDNNICTLDSCDTVIGCVHTPRCNDNNLCTIDTCNTTTGSCIYTPMYCDDRNICTMDTCVNGVCQHTLIALDCNGIPDNNFTMLDTGNHMAGGTNDIMWAWDETLKTSVSTSNQISNAILSTTCQYNGVSWLAHDVAVYGPGCYDVFAGCPAGSPGCGLGSSIHFCVKTGEIGIHMLINWNDNNDIDVVNVMKPNAVFGPSPMWTGGPGSCGANASSTVWSWMSYDWDGDGINGGRMVDGPFPGFSPNFNLNKVTTDPCLDAATRCNDNNACTTDLCNTATGACVHTEIFCCDACERPGLCDPVQGCPLNIVCFPSCSDNNSCTIDSCNTVTGVCIHAPIDCNDNNACTTDSCDTATGCVHTAVVCPDDNNKCTHEYCDTVRGCTFDQTVCFTGYCDPATGICREYCPLGCNDNNACTIDNCMILGPSEPGMCVYTVKNCNDNNACTTDTCNSATGCVFTPINCNDNNACTTDTCNTATGCVFTPAANGTACSDNNYCTIGDTCANGICVPGTPKVCNDNNPCTDDTCIPVLPVGCVFTPNTKPCDDGNACTVNDTCKNKACTGTPKNCDDNNACTTDSCNTVTGNCAHASTCPSCAGQPNGTLCTDLNACTLNDTCQNGVCVPGPARMCNDNNPCTTDICDPLNGCVFTIDNTLPCSDGNSCTDNDYCLNGVCKSGVLRSCDDGNICTDDKMVPVIAQCCVHVPNNKSCDDNNACTTNDKCNKNTGICTGTPKNCNDYNSCTTDFCDPATGICLHTTICGDGCTGRPDGSPCTDNNACTVDQCINQVCVSTPQVCNDNNPCTTDTCDPAIGCVFTNNTLPCSDNNYCTIGDTCTNGVCVPGPLMSCDDGNVCTSDVMAPFLPGCCTHGVNTLPCNDLNECTVGDVCANRVCVPGTPKTCDAGLMCNPVSGVCE